MHVFSSKREGSKMKKLVHVELAIIEISIKNILYWSEYAFWTLPSACNQRWLWLMCRIIWSRRVNSFLQYGQTKSSPNPWALLRCLAKCVTGTKHISHTCLEFLLTCGQINYACSYLSEHCKLENVSIIQKDQTHIASTTFTASIPFCAIISDMKFIFFSNWSQTSSPKHKQIAKPPLNQQQSVN